MTPDEIVYHIGEGSLYSHINNNLNNSEKGSQVEESIDSKVENEVLIGTEEQEPNRENFNQGYSENDSIDETTEDKDIVEIESLDELKKDDKIEDYRIRKIKKSQKYFAILPINHKSGLHLRPAGNIAEESRKYKSNIKIANYSKVDGNLDEIEYCKTENPINILCTELKYNQIALIKTEGHDSKKAACALKKLFQNNFYLED